MIPYITVLFLFIIMLANQNKRNESINGYYAFFTLFILAALRSPHTGVDLERYIDIFVDDEESLLLKQTEWGFALFNKFIKFFTIEPQWYIVITSLFIQLPIFIFLKKISPNILLSYLIFFILTSDSGYLFTYSGIRQSLAFGLTLWCFYFFDHKNFFWSVFLLFCAFSIHNSVIFCIPIVLLTLIPISNLFFSVLLIASAIFGFWGSFKADILVGLFDADIINNYIVHADYIDDFQRSFYGIFAIIVPNTLFALFSLKNNLNNFYSKLFYFGVIGSNIMVNSVQIQRYFYCFVVLQILIIPWLIKKTKSSSEKLILIISVGFLVLFFLYFYFNMMTASLRINDKNFIVPYKFYFQ